MMRITAKVWRRTGYALFALVCFMMGLYATFDANVLAQRIAKEVDLQSHGDWTMAVGQAHLWRGTGLVLENVQLKPAGGAPIAIEQVRARLRLMPLLIFRPSIYAQVILGEGLIELWVTRKNRAFATALEAHNIDLAKPPVVPKLIGIATTGTVEAQGELIIFEDARQSEGSADVQLHHISVGPGEMMGLGLPQIDLGSINLAAEAGEGHLRLTKFSQDGGVIRLEAQGRSELAGTLASSTLDSCLRFEVDQAFLNKNPKLKGVLQLAEVQLRKDPEGYLNAPLLGRLGDPQLRPGICPKRP